MSLVIHTIVQLGTQILLCSFPYCCNAYFCYTMKVLVETAMLAAVGGLAYLLSTLLRLESGLGYALPMPIVLAAMRGGPAAGFKTMGATGFLLVGEHCAARFFVELVKF
jgi:hypothetical protein